MNEIKPKKMVSRSVAISLGIICILLVAIIAYFSVTGISAQNSYNNLQNQNQQLQDQNGQLQTWLTGNVSQIANLLTWLGGNETLLSEIQANNTDLSNTLGLAKTDSLNFGYFAVNENYGSYSWGFTPNVFTYAGYVSVWLVSSTLTNTYARINYSSVDNSSYEVNLNQTEMVTPGETAIFPVLPASILSISYVTITVGNVTSLSTNLPMQGATADVIITYHY
jgi:hypothetical protein